jgi:DNA repair protein RAD50
LVADIEEKKSRINKVEADLKTTNYDERISERTTKARVMEDKRDELNTEIRTLSLRADARARLDIKRAEVRTKTNDVKNMCVSLTCNVGIQN